MTKSIVSVLAIMMIEKGKLRLYDPISEYDPHFKHMMVLHTNGLMETANALITIENLLTHPAIFFIMKSYLVAKLVHITEKHGCSMTVSGNYAI